jgi:hypothetical protein
MAEEEEEALTTEDTEKAFMKDLFRHRSLYELGREKPYHGGHGVRRG